MTEATKRGIDRFYNSKWGIMTHYLNYLQNGDNRTDWNTCVNEFDTDLLAKQLHELGAGYYLITIAQCEIYMIAPNETFAKITGIKTGEGCSKRDLIEDLYNSLSKYDIDLYLYLPANGPCSSEKAGEAFGYNPKINKGQKISKEFVDKWASVIEEYSLRYGDKVKGWWYDAGYEWIGFTDGSFFETLSKASKAGNPESIVAFNYGVETKFKIPRPQNDYTAGEMNEFDCIYHERFHEGQQTHLLVPLGIDHSGKVYRWMQEGLYISKECLANYLKRNIEFGCVTTLEMMVDRKGNLSKDQFEAVKWASERVNGHWDELPY